jgi:membrane protease YdiL (CAAX protease family)
VNRNSCKKRDVRRDDLRRRLVVVLIGAAFEGGLALVAWGLGWLLGQAPLADCHWTAAGAGLGVAAALPMLLLFAAVRRWPVGGLVRIQRFFEEVLQPLLRDCTLAELALLSLLAGVGEEMLFRGVLQPVLMRWLGPAPGLLSASVLFGLFHPITATYVVLAAGLGLYLGLVAWAGGNLLIVIVAHALYDFVVLVYLLRLAQPAR